jgi:hypothetical protein
MFSFASHSEWLLKSPWARFENPLIEIFVHQSMLRIVNLNVGFPFSHRQQKYKIFHRPQRHWRESFPPKALGSLQVLKNTFRFSSHKSSDHQSKVRRHLVFSSTRFRSSV